MSGIPQNIIEIQSNLQNPALVPMKKLLEYVDGSNPEVPPFLALIEMDRRKSAQQQPEDEPKGTIKDQTINALLGRPQVNPAAAPTGINPTAAPTGIDPTMAQKMVDPTMQARQIMPQQAPPQVNPGTMVQAARGGLMSIPMNMFKAQNYAAGGIVAFAGGGDTPKPEDKYVEVSPGNYVLKSEVDAAKKASQPVRGDSYVQESPGGKYVMRSELPRPQAQAKPATAQPAPEAAVTNPPVNNNQWTETATGMYAPTSEVGQNFPPRQQYKLGNQTIFSPRSQEEILAGLPSITPMRSRPEDMTIDQAAQRRKEIMKAAGVSEDPYSEAKQFQRDVEARQAKEREGEPIDRLLAMARAFAKADPTSGLGAQGAAASEASASLEATQKAIREKQDAVSRDFRLSMAKEEDARRRGDADGIAAALARQKQDQAEFDKLQMEHDKLTQGRIKTAAEVQQGELAQAKLPIDIQNALTQQNQADALARHYRSQAAHQQFNEDESKRTRPSADDLLYTKIMEKVSKDPQIKQRVEQQIKDTAPGSAEYIRLQKEINALIKLHFSQAPHLMPPHAPELLEQTEKKEQPGFWKRVFGGSSPQGPSSMPGGNLVPYNQLPLPK